MAKGDIVVMAFRIEDENLTPRGLSAHLTHHVTGVADVIDAIDYPFPHKDGTSFKYGVLSIYTDVETFASANDYNLTPKQIAKVAASVQEDIANDYGDINNLIGETIEDVLNEEIVPKEDK